MHFKGSLRRSFLLLPITLWTLAIPTMLRAEPPPRPPKHEISLEFLNTDPDDTPTQVLSGWPITLRLSANNELGISRSFFTPNKFPIFGQTGFIVFEEPDDPLCLSWVPNDPPCEENETFVEFTPDTDLPGLNDSAGNPLCQIALTAFGGGGNPSIFTYEKELDANGNLISEGNTALTPVGPFTGPAEDVLEMRCVNRLGLGGPCSVDSDCTLIFPDATCQEVPTEVDGVGLGPDDDNPGLVLLADTGVGLGFNPDFILDDPLTQKNLAGMMTTSGYELDDATSRTSVLAQLTVPPGLVQPIVLIDDCVEDVGINDPNCRCDDEALPECTGDPLVRVDGSPVQSFQDLNALRSFLDSIVITIRAFVVNGKAPSVLEDLNADGIVNFEDAEEAGFQLLSGEEVITIRQLHEELFLGFDFDFDGNGVAPKVAPVSPGSLTGVPR